MFSLRSFQLSGPKRLLQVTLRKATYHPRYLSITANKMANANSQTSRVISEASKQEGGPYKGSTAAKLQSEVTKQRNAENTNSENTPPQAQSTNTSDQLSPQEQSQLDREANYAEAAKQVGTKMTMNPASIKEEEGDMLHSREVRAFGASEKGGLASQAQSQAAENMGVKKNPANAGAGVAAQVTPEQQSQIDRQANFKETAEQVVRKMQTDPTSITKEDGDMMHSRETKATGTTEKGGLASRVQSQAAENMGMKKQ